MVDQLYVLVSGWPASRKTTVARGLAERLCLPLLAKDEIKEALCDVLGRPATDADSQRLGRVAVTALLRIATSCPAGAVLDSTWYRYTLAFARELPGRTVEVRCVLPREVAKARYVARADGRHPGHLDLAGSEDELWGSPVEPLGVGPLVTVDTSVRVDEQSLVRIVLARAETAR